MDPAGMHTCRMRDCIYIQKKCFLEETLSLLQCCEKKKTKKKKTCISWLCNDVI